MTQKTNNKRKIIEKLYITRCCWTIENNQLKMR